VHNIFVIARLTFREAARRRIILAAVVLGLAFLVLFAVGFALIRREYLRAVDVMNPIWLSEFASFFLMTGLYTVNFLMVMMTVLTSVDTISGEVASGSIQTLVSKPVLRREVLAGKWLGFCALLTAYLVFMFGGVVGLVALVSGYTPPNWAAGLGLIWLNSVMLLCLCLWGGTILSTLANGVMVFGLYGIAFVGGWIEQIGVMLQNKTAVQVGVITSLLLPSEALWRRAAYEMQSALSGIATGMTPFSPLSVPSPAMVGYAVLYGLVAVGLAVYQFGRKDL